MALAVVAALLAACVPSEAVAKVWQVDDAPSLKKAVASASPGDEVVLAAGEWRDQKLVVRGQGKKGAPITVRAATPGQTVVTGASVLRIGGEHVVVAGLLFRDPASEISDLIQFRVDSKQLASHCRLTDCAVISTKSGDNAQECRWVNLYGEGHRVDHCALVGRSGKGTTFVVWLGDGSEGRHRIDHNYFGPRERLGKNGGETLRIGDSETSMLLGECVVEQNLFEKCNGETECVSNKSCGNTYRKNTFLEVSGTLTLRHGNGCLVEENVFRGNKARGTGGIRIIGEDHVVRGNYMENLTGDDARSALTLMMGIPNSPANRYFQVKRAVIENNRLVDCEHSLLIGLSDDRQATLAPVSSIIRGNVIVAKEYAVVEARCSLEGIRWDNNHFLGDSLGISPVAGVEVREGDVRAPTPIGRDEVGASWRFNPNSIEQTE
ncbi:Chondroitinase-B precursor [Botrimarina colliarenosi]|uniref:Chondroitinase-B n=1 Tax=Botrimarina colliarenosi TaxID=2528001 RepID=A0A5C6AIK4_9BACT|nr:polysaccharide lyase 6 family protein [Botrimarina colliarenosi]TWT99459.1 Chondroitinase-B precursor [Botrimarina colliarenosi]